jgi:putative spermidine/putrescine transport system permease protein
VSPGFFDRALRAAGLAVVGFILLPIFVVVPLSLSSAQYLAFPPPGYSLRWYSDVLSRDYWLTPALFSAKVALATTALAVVLGTLASLGLVRRQWPGRTLLSAFVISPMIVPFIIVGIALYFALSRVGLVDSFLGLVLAHTVLAIPRVVVIVTSVLQRIDLLLERAAMTLGASPAQAFVLVTVPAIAPGLLAAAIVAFLTSFDEIIVTLFVSGPHSATLPRRMWDSLLNELTPALAVVSTLLLVALVGFFAVLQGCRRLDWAKRWTRSGQEAATEVSEALARET